METDREVLIWLHERLVQEHEEHPGVDYIRRLRHIIVAQPPKKVSCGQNEKGCNNSLKEMGEELKHKSDFERRMIKESEC